MTDDWLIWQLADSAFPSGGFAHSGGLEAAAQARLLTSPAQLSEFIQAQLATTAHGQTPYLLASLADPSRRQVIDGELDAFLSNHVANRASKAQGRALLAAASRIFNDGILADQYQSIRSAGADAPTGHLAPAFGVVANRLKLDATRSCRLFLFLVVRNAIASAVRLGMIGPLEGQSIQHRLAPAADAWAIRALRQAPTPGEPIRPAQVSPILEILQGAHDRLYSRLFQS